MAREESDREDLLRNATALVERIELAPAEAGFDEAEHVVIGFRSDGAMSIYFGNDAAYHFNSKGQLRRAYYGGRLFKAEHGRLIALERVRTENEVQLLRHKMLDDEQATFLAGMLERLRNLMQQCNQNTLVTVGQVPADADVLHQAVSWLSQMDEVKIAKSPHAR